MVWALFAEIVAHCNFGVYLCICDRTTKYDKDNKHV